MDHYFTTCQHNTKEPANIEISTPISLEVWLQWCQTDMVFLDSKWLLSKPIINSNSTGLKMYSC